MKKILSIFFIFVFSILFLSPAYADKSDEFITINRNSEHLGSRLHKEYKGYIYTIKNNSDKDIKIDAVSLKDNITGKVAYSTIKQSSLATGAKAIGVGLVFALPTLSLSLIGSVIVAPFAMIANTCGNIGAKQDSKRYDKTFNEAELKASSSLELKTLAPKSSSPEISIFYHIQDESEVRQISY